MSCVAHVNESATHADWLDVAGMSHVGMMLLMRIRHVAHVNESCRACG